MGELEGLYQQWTERAAQIPEKPDGYQLKLPAEVKLPEGYKLNTDDPLYRAGREIAHASGLPQAEFEKFVGAYVNQQIAIEEARRANFARERDSLGPTAGERIRHVETAIRNKLGEGDVARAVIKGIDSANAIIGLEKLLASEGTSFASNGRSAEPAGIPGYENMSARQKFAIAQALADQKAH